MFRGKFLALLREVFADGKREFHGQLRPLRQSTRFHNLLRELKSIKWVVHAKPPLGGPGPVLQYLARYTHRVAISNGRLLITMPVTRNAGQRPRPLDGPCDWCVYITSIYPASGQGPRAWKTLANEWIRKLNVPAVRPKSFATGACHAGP